MDMRLVDQGVQHVAIQQVDGVHRAHATRHVSLGCHRHSSSSACTSSAVTGRGERIVGRPVRSSSRNEASASPSRGGRSWRQPAADQIGDRLVHASAAVRGDGDDRLMQVVGKIDGGSHRRVAPS